MCSRHVKCEYQLEQRHNVDYVRTVPQGFFYTFLSPIFSLVYSREQICN